MAGYNSQTYIEEWVRHATRRELQSGNSPVSTGVQILRSCNDALAYFATKYKQHERRMTRDLESGEQSYRLPHNRFNTAIRAVYLIKENGDELPLTRISEDEMESLFKLTDTSSDSGIPLYWCYSTRYSGSIPKPEIRIRPAPSWDKSEGVIFRMPSFPEPLHRVQNTALKLAEFTAGSMDVYIRGTGGGDGDVVFRAGDEITPRIAIDTDGAAISNPSGIFWYACEDVDRPADGSVLTELVTNGTFTGSAAGWTLGGAMAYNVNNLTSIGAGTASQVITNALSGNYYRLEIDVTTLTSGSLTVAYNGTTIKTITATGTTQYVYFLADVSGGTLLLTNGAGTVILDNVSIKAITHVMLERGYTQPTETGILFLAGQVPDLEFSVPGGLGFAPVHWALGDYFYSNPLTATKADRFYQLAKNRLDLFNADETNTAGYSDGLGPMVETNITQAWFV